MLPSLLSTAAPSIHERVQGGETSNVEFKSTLRTNLHTGEKDPKMEFTVLRTVAGFLNSPVGGTLVIGVADDGTPIGLEVDGFPNEDKMSLHLVNLLKERMGGQHALFIHPHFGDYGDFRALIVKCEPAKSPTFVKDGNAERLFVRYGPSTQELTGAQAQEFIKQRFTG
jgi:predicted HTH transcriptional regulator